MACHATVLGGDRLAIARHRAGRCRNGRGKDGQKFGSSPICGFARSQTEGSGTCPCRQDARRRSGPSLRPGTCLTSILGRGSRSGSASNREQDVLSSAAWRRDSRRCQTPPPQPANRRVALKPTVQPRHSARSRGIHPCGDVIRRRGSCDFAQDDEARHCAQGLPSSQIGDEPKIWLSFLVL